MPIKSKRGKKGFFLNWGKAQQMPKVNTRKNIKLQTWFFVNKASRIFKWLDYLSIKKVRFSLWPLLREYWSFRWTQNEWHGYMSFFYKDNKMKISK